MYRKAAVLSLLFSFFVFCKTNPNISHLKGDWIPLKRAPLKTAEQKLSGTLHRKQRVLVDLAVQVDLQKLAQILSERGANKRERRQLVITALKQTAEKSQRTLRPFLKDLQKRGWISSYRGFSVVNRMLLEATPEAIQALAESDEVAAIVGETQMKTPSLATTEITDEQRVKKTSWAIKAIGADKAWQQGLNGKGIIVGIIDSGASDYHEQLRGNFRGGERSWYDPQKETSTLHDSVYGHGSGVLSCAVGQNVQGITFGTAPGAQWIACAGLPEGHYNNVLLTQCADWMLNVGQPDVLMNAWQLPEKGCDLSFHNIVDAWRAAEIFPVFAAGNNGPDPHTDRSPANYVKLYPGNGIALSVGGVASDQTAFIRSAKGPNSCDGSVYPVLVAPAKDLPVALPLTSSTYMQVEGTSYAIGFVAGAAAILLQQNPEATVSQLEDALRSSAIDLGQKGPDQTFGYGQLNIPAALQMLRKPTK